MPMVIEGSVEVVANQQRRSTAPLPVYYSLPESGLTPFNFTAGVLVQGR